ncbi:MAG: arginine-ornithine antiporter, partial [Carnobacterium jeotgali]
DYLLLTMLLYAPGIIIYAWVQKENKEKLFTKSEWIAAAVVVVLFLIAIVQISNGSIDISNM